MASQAVIESRSGRLLGIEGLRALAALAVLLHHVWLHSEAAAGRPDLPLEAERLGAWMRFGLTLFFVLSGFLLFRPFAAAALADRPRPSIAAYARNRALRILPAYWVILLLTAFAVRQAIVVYPTEIGALEDPATLALDLALLQNYRTDTLLTGIGPAWSLAVEAVFYVLLVPLGLLAIRLGRRGPWLAVALLLVTGTITRAALTAGAVAEPMETLVRISFPAHADLFALGMTVAIWRVQAEAAALRLPGWLPAASLGAAAAIALVVLWLAPGGAGGVGQVWDLIMGLACALLLFAACVVVPNAGARLLEWRPLVWLGLCSYSVYLWHTPIIFLLRDRGLDAGSPGELLVFGIAALAVTLVLSAITYRLVERPALARKRRVPADSAAP